MIFLLIRWLVTREYNLSRDREFNLRIAILLELASEIGLIASAIVVSMGLN
jgi:hypothetical protein